MVGPELGHVRAVHLEPPCQRRVVVQELPHARPAVLVVLVLLVVEEEHLGGGHKQAGVDTSSELGAQQAWSEGRLTLGTVTSSGSCWMRKSTSNLKLLTSIHLMSLMFCGRRTGTAQ